MQKFLLDEQAYTFVAMAYQERSGKVAFLLLITTLTPALAIRCYGYCYRIESMLRHLNSNGIQLQFLNLKSAHKIRLLMAALVLAYTRSVVYGLARYKHAIKVKKTRLTPDELVSLWFRPVAESSAIFYTSPRCGCSVWQPSNHY